MAARAQATPGLFRARRGCAYSRLVYLCGRLGVPMSAWRVDLEVTATRRSNLRRLCGSGAQVTLLMPGNKVQDFYEDTLRTVEQVAACRGAVGLVFPSGGASGDWVVELAKSAVSAMACRLTLLRMPSCPKIAAAVLEAGALPPSLTELDLNNCDLEDPDLDALSKLPNLVTLKISANRYLSEPTIVELLAALPSLTSLDLSGIRLVVDEQMARVLAGMPLLASLVFADGLRQWDFPGGVQFRTLTALDVVGSSAYLPQRVLKEMPALRVLRMSKEGSLNALKALPPSQLEELQCDKPEDFRDLDSRMTPLHPRDWPCAPKTSGKTELDHVLGRQRALRRLTLRGHGPDLNPWRLIKYLPPGLTALDLSGSSVARHGESSLALDLEEIACALAVACPGLEELVVSDYRWPASSL
jgi:hypothetical protein